MWLTASWRFYWLNEPWVFRELFLHCHSFFMFFFCLLVCSWLELCAKNFVSSPRLVNQVSDLVSVAKLMWCVLASVLFYTHTQKWQPSDILALIVVNSKVNQFFNMVKFKVFVTVDIKSKIKTACGPIADCCHAWAQWDSCTSFSFECGGWFTFCLKVSARHRLHIFTSNTTH
jgi:hypothetical protein